MIARLARDPIPPLPSWATEMLAGFVYWVVFLLVLEPGNILRAHHAGRALTLDHEALRITAAAGLGAAATPLTLWLSRRLFPLKASRRPLVLLASMAAISVAMILASCFLAAWVFEHEWLPTVRDFTNVLTGNGLLVLFALLALCALDHIRPVRSSEAAGPDILRQVAVKTRGWQVIVPLDTVERIEAQGNYLALHVGQTVHLIRDTLTAFAARLDPSRFIRVHRSAVVAVDQIAVVENFDNGDGMIRLHSGIEVKVSRNYRKALLARWR